jgi:endonuclease/exonuclease/phosphatase family metal-dependent hydrolase
MDVIVAPGHGRSIAILSRFTIMETFNHALIHADAPRSFCQANIRTPSGKTLPIFGLHLHPHAGEEDENIRQAQMACVLRVSHDLRTQRTPHVLAGDFNANAPFQEIDPAECKEATRKSWHANGGKLPRRVIQNLLDHGYVDTLEAVRPDAARSEASFTTHEPGQRVDYIFTFGIGRPRDAWIEHDRLAQFASDHYPVCVDLDV